MFGKIKSIATVVFALSTCLVSLPESVRAQVTDLPAGTYGGQFRDESTGKIWLDYNAVLGNITDKAFVLSNSPFRLATTAEIQSIAQASKILDPATGPFTACNIAPGGPHPEDCKHGIFDDSATGQNSSRFGIFGAQRNSTDILNMNDFVQDTAVGLFGTWAIQRGPALRAGTNPFGADFDGDGKDEKIVWRPSEGNWYLRFSGTDEGTVHQWGLNGDIPIVGDYDGDLIPDLVVWRPSNGTWYVKTSKSLYDASQAIQQQFGLPGDIPMKADFDSDDKLDFAVWRPSEGNWYVLQSSNQQAVVTQWGLSRDVPVTGGRPQL